jgi:hypothetical protein
LQLKKIGDRSLQERILAATLGPASFPVCPNIRPLVIMHISIGCGTGETLLIFLVSRGGRKVREDVDWFLRLLTINVLTMGDAQDEDQDLPFIDLVNDAVSADADTTQAREITLEQFADVRILG